MATSASDREKLYHLVDELPDGEIATAKRVLEALKALTESETTYGIDDAPIDDEPVTAQEEIAIIEAHAAINRGELVSTEEARRRFPE